MTIKLYMYMGFVTILPLGLPMELLNMDKKSASVFSSLLKEESYPHYEGRVMATGEQNTGKTTLTRILSGKEPIKFRKSTDGIDLYTGFSFVDRDKDEWLTGKQSKHNS